MRSARELAFRGGQELANQRVWWMPPRRVPIHDSPLRGLPAAAPVAERLRGTTFARGIEELAQSILDHRFPIPGGLIDTGERIDWRRDYRNNVTSGTKYFRLVKYLDLKTVGDHKVVWDFNRHQHLVVLSQAFLLTGNPQYVAEIEKEIDSWFPANPFMRGVNWTSALEVALRALSWTWIFHLVGSHLSDRTRSSLMTGLYQHGCYIENNLSVYFAPNTHILGEAVALHALGVLFPKFARASRWAALGERMVNVELARQVRDDGSHFEQSSYYHMYALDMFLFHCVLARPSEQIRLKLTRMADYLAALMGPDRTLPLIGDDDGGRLFHPYGRCEWFGRSTLATCALMFGESRWDYDELDLHDQAAWWIQGRGVSETSRPHRGAGESHLFDLAGMAVLRSGPVHALVDAGPFGGAGGGHSHSDTLSLVVRHGADEVLVDAGTYTYVSDPRMRDWFRGSAAHNTIRIDEHDQAVPIGPFKWRDAPSVDVHQWETTATQDILDAQCLYGGFTHRRKIVVCKTSDLFSGGHMIIYDHVDGPPGSHVTEQFWHPGAPTELVRPEHLKIGSRSHLIVMSGTAFESVEQWRSERFGEKSPVMAFVVRKQSACPVTFWTLLAFGEVADDVRFTIDTNNGSSELVCSNGRRVTVSSL